jgi:transposase-like protein
LKTVDAVTLTVGFEKKDETHYNLRVEAQKSEPCPMAIVTLNLPEVNQEVANRPETCPHCGSSLLQGWGTVRKPLRDPQLKEVEVRRFRCCDCGHTFRHYPEGVGGADQSERLQQLAAICWVLGMSTRMVTGVLGAFGIPLCHMTVWRDVQALAEAVSLPAPPGGIRVLGVDGFYASIKGQDSGMVVAVDMGTGAPVALARIDEKDRPALFAWLEALQEQFGVEVMVSDDFNPYFVAAERLGLDHQICRFHYLRWVNRLLKNLQKQLDEEWNDLLDEVRLLLEELPPEGGVRIYELYRQIPPPPRIRDRAVPPLARLQKLLLRLSDNWASYRHFLEQADVPATNNATERAIGRWRTRSRSVRGFKTWSGLVNAFILCNAPLV